MYEGEEGREEGEVEKGKEAMATGASFAFYTESEGKGRISR